MRKSLAEVREVTLITAVRMSKERRLSEEIESSRGRGYTRSRGRGFFFFFGRGKTDGAPRGGGHQMSF